MYLTGGRVHLEALKGLRARSLIKLLHALSDRGPSGLRAIVFATFSERERASEVAKGRRRFAKALEEDVKGARE